MADPDLTLAPLGFLELDPPALLSVAGEAGFGSVSLRTAPAVPGGMHHPLGAGSPELRQTLARMRATGVGVLQIELIALDRTTDVPGARPMLEAGAALGATRIVVTGDDPDPSVVAARLAEIADLAREYGIAVDLEFMPFRAIAGLEEAVAAAEAAGRDNVAVMIDALHLARSGGAPADVAATEPGRLAVLQLCDAPLAAPAPHLLADEAREGRLLPGHGGLPLRELLAAMPAGALLACEVPLAGGHTGHAPLERARALHTATVALLEELAP
jgi:sugar phosphate isomerase/epimerase